MSILAIDQGTTSTRALVLQKSGKSTITKVIEHQQHYPKQSWVEHDANEIVANIKNCIETSLDKFPDISAIGIDNQGESCLAWHAETKQAITPIIVWQDSRSQPLISQLKQQGLEEKIQQITGLPLDAYFSASKLAWIINNHSTAKELLSQGLLRLGTTDAYFLDYFSGRFATDITTASRTSLMNLNTGQWDDYLCHVFGVPIECLPKIEASTGDFGTYKFKGKTIPISASICDQQASLYGHGCRDTGDAKITFGTGVFALALVGDEPLSSSEQGLVATVAWKKDSEKAVYAMDGGVYNAGSAVNWAKSIGLFENYEQLNQFEKSSAIERGLVFVPALSGLACPHWDRTAAGLWIGLNLDTDKNDMVQAVLEGIACRAVEVVSAIDHFAEIGNSISIDGGLSKNPYFCQYLANVLNKQVTIQKNAELTALGTAMLADRLQTISKTETSKLIIYKPQADYSHHLKRFSKAIERSKNWADTL